MDVQCELTAEQPVVKRSSRGREPRAEKPSFANYPPRLVRVPKMPRDVLGLDPYQASAVSCAKRGAILAALLTLGAIGLTAYGLNGGGELYTYLGATSFGTSILSFCLANRCARHTTARPRQHRADSRSELCRCLP